MLDIMRDTTERPEGIEAGTLKLVGVDENVIYDNFTTLLDNRQEYLKMSEASNPYGDGFASKKIADILEKDGRIYFQGYKFKEGILSSIELGSEEIYEVIYNEIEKRITVIKE